MKAGPDDSTVPVRSSRNSVGREDRVNHPRVCNNKVGAKQKGPIDLLSGGECCYLECTRLVRDSMYFWGHEVGEMSQLVRQLQLVVV